MAKKVSIIEISVDGKLVLSKECTNCKIVKPLESSYDNSKATSYGKQPSCKECRKTLHKETERKYRENNREKLIAKSKNYREENNEKLKKYNLEYKNSHKEEISEYNKIYYRLNKERILEYSKQRFSDYYYERHKNTIILNSQKRRALLKSLPNDLTTSDIENILKHFDFKCPLSGSEDIHLDHFIALSTGFGGTVFQNIIPMEASLNKSKKDRNPFEWIKTRDDIQIEKFNEVVKYLAHLNSVTIEDYKSFVYSCYENKQVASS